MLKTQSSIRKVIEEQAMNILKAEGSIGKVIELNHSIYVNEYNTFEFIPISGGTLGIILEVYRIDVISGLRFVCLFGLRKVIVKSIDLNLI